MDIHLDILFDHENRLRALEKKPKISAEDWVQQQVPKVEETDEPHVDGGSLPVEKPTEKVRSWSPQQGRWMWVKVPGEGEAAPKTA